MKNRKCPYKKSCWDYKDGNCGECTFGKELTKLHKRIDRLKKQNKTLTIQRNAWALTAKRLGEEGKWVSVAERLPEEVGNYCVYTTQDKAYVSYYAPQYEFAANVTHWQPLPAPPMGEEKTIERDENGT